MPANKDLTADAVAASPVPFVVTHPCPACHGQGMVDGQTCRGCHATGVGRFFHGTKANLKPGALRVGSRSAVRGARGSFSSLDLSRGERCVTEPRSDWLRAWVEWVVGRPEHARASQTDACVCDARARVRLVRARASQTEACVCDARVRVSL